MPGSALAYDSAAYANALAYLGEPLTVPGLPWPVIRQAIPGSGRFDVLGPWPYGSPPDPAGAAEALAHLRALGAVTLTAFARPDRPLDAVGLAAAGLEVVVLKPHFVHAADEPIPVMSKKTRYNLSAARRRWRVQPLDLAQQWPAVAALHTELAQRRTMSRITHLDDAHFARLAEVPGAAGLCVVEDGTLVAALVVVVAPASVHFHAIVGVEAAYRERAFYALYDEALRHWGAERLVCLGGAPGGPDGAGIEKFKGRFATSTRPVHMLTAVLDAPACAELVARRGLNQFFPPYRTAAG
jgi:hypothetical protein